MTLNDIRVTIQGVSGCFHEAAAREYFSKHLPDKRVQAVECETFEKMFDLLGTDVSLLGIMAIENTIAGPLLQNHELVTKSKLFIAGEHKVRISHVLAALPDDNIDDIREVISHPMALMQCAQFLATLPDVKISEAFDTAGSAALIAKQQSRGKAAVCSQLAAEKYGLKILEAGIETNKRNFTRFLILAHNENADILRYSRESADKSSMVFTLPHTQGALSKVLTILSFYDMNLTKIQSTPIVGKEWEYRFYVDLSFKDYNKYLQALEAVRPLTSDLKILGEYKSCNNSI